MTALVYGQDQSCVSIQDQNWVYGQDQSRAGFVFYGSRLMTIIFLNVKFVTSSLAHSSFVIEVVQFYQD